MTHREGNFVFLCAEAPQQCDFCGKIAELRPYGPNGEVICFECGMKDETTTARVFEEKVLEVGPQGGNPT